MIPEQVSHYTKKDIALENILGANKLRLGLLGFTNDPRESKDWGYPIMDAPHRTDDNLEVVSNFLNLMNAIQAEANRIRFEEWKILCLTQNYLTTGSKTAEMLNHFQFGYCRSRMWAHYADNHKGVCIILNGKKLNEIIIKELKSNCKIFHGAVEYEDLRSISSQLIDYSDIEKYGLTGGLRNYYFKYYKEIFLTKSKDWESEYEYRWLVHSPDNSPKFIPIDGIIESVHVGVDFPEVYEPSLISLCQKYDIPAGRISWQNGVPTADLSSIYSPMD